MKNRRWRGAVGVVVMLLAAGVGAEPVAERLAVLEKKFEQEASAREEVLLSRIRELEGKVATLSEQVASASQAPVTGTGTDAELFTRIDSLEEQLLSIEEEQMNNPLKDIHIGGYGELHYNALSGSGGASDKREIDFHRFVLMVNKDFGERIRFFSELEVEHVMAGASEKGYVALEQAYLDFDLTDWQTARAGLFLLPVGLLNTTHEPTRFYGVERNPVENQILPTTWFEGGAGLHGLLTDSLTYEAYVHSGLKTSAGSSYSVRSGRQKVAHASASDPATTVALNWSVPGVTIGGSAQYQVDMTQGSDPDPVSAWMGEVHMDLQRGAWGLRALYAQWNLSGDGPESFGADRQFGWYIEPSYKLTDTLGVFARYNQWDNRAGGGSDSGKEQIDLGVNWWPHEQVVLKADYQWQNNEDGKNQNGINLGVGYDF